MKKIVGVRFRHTGKSYYYDPGDMELSIGTGVIVQSGDGKEYGKVSIPPMEVEEEKLPAIIKQILRIATEDDKRIVAENREKEEEAFWICKEKIRDLSLPMKLIHAEYTFERNKLLFYFTADGRVDFRELVRVLASVFRTRIELRQVGVRDETKLMGGIGICGRELCCTTYLSGFVPVSIKMAKEQNLSLNPSKISGVCGRLMCCLAHEEEVYEYLNQTLPKSGDYATNVEGRTGVIRSVNILKQSVLVIFEDGDTREMKEYAVSDVGLTPRRMGVPSPEEVEKMQAELEETLRAKMEEEIAQAIEDGNEVEYTHLKREVDELNVFEEGRKQNRDSGKRVDRSRNRKNTQNQSVDEEDSRNNSRHGQRSRSQSQDTNRRQQSKKRDGGRNQESGKGLSKKRSQTGKPYGKKQSRTNDRKPSHSQKRNSEDGRGRTQNPSKHSHREGNTDSKKRSNGSGHRNGGYSRGYRTDRNS